MTVKDRLSAILAELTVNSLLIPDNELDALADDIMTARHVFVAGAGRSGIAGRAFVNRLMHLGRSASVVGDVTSPHSQEGDLLLIASGSGETTSLVALARKAEASGVRVATITMDRGATIAGIASTVAVLPGSSPKLREGTVRAHSIQPMGSAFEQMMSLSFDALILELMTRFGETSDSMFPRHADLE